MSEIVVLIGVERFQGGRHETLPQLMFRLICRSLKVCRINKPLETWVKVLFRGNLVSFSIPHHIEMYPLMIFDVGYSDRLPMNDIIFLFLLRVTSRWKDNAKWFPICWVEYVICNNFLRPNGCWSKKYYQTAIGPEVQYHDN